MITSPLSGSKDVSLLQEINVAELVSLYKIKAKIDVSKYFYGQDSISIYQCNQTGYKFYYPLNLEGDNSFYAKLGEQAWYYDPNRWEHQKALGLMDSNKKVLEVGSGSGFFLKRMQDKGLAVTGLELNKDGIKEGKNKGVQILNEYIENHAVNNQGVYDIVCSFQVLEHVADVNSFLRAKIKCLKKGGLLIIAVPNDDSYIGHNKHNSKVLNMPPHHVGLWNQQSLTSLENIFPINLKNIYTEPLRVSGVDIYTWNVFYRALGNDFLPRLVWKLNMHKWLQNRFLKSSNILGHTIMAVYSKTD